MSDSIVTEYWLAQNFTPKSGITPGSDNLQGMDCDQIAARYLVSISGATTTGLRLPAQNQITATAGNYPITRIGNHTVTAQIASTINMTLSLSTSAKLFVVTIKAMVNDRESGSPSWNGVPLTKAVAANGAEIWYITPPASGSHTLSIPNSTTQNLYITVAWYSCDGSISLHATNQRSSIGTSIAPNIPVTANLQTMIIDSVCFRANSPNKLLFAGHSDNSIWSGVGGAAFGAASQDVSFLPPNTITRSMIWSLQEPMDCRSVVACFTSS